MGGAKTRSNGIPNQEEEVVMDRPYFEEATQNTLHPTTSSHMEPTRQEEMR